MTTFANFSAFCLPLIIFSFWQLCGLAVLRILQSQRNILQNILLAPSIGMATTLLIVFIINRLGLPVEKFAQTLAAVLFFLSIILLNHSKTIFPWKRYLPFMALFALALFVTGNPLLKYGFDWTSFSNDDMANYCLGALRFLKHGYGDQPVLQNILSGTDYSSIYWFLYLPGMSRSGSELTLAWTSGVLTLTPMKLFMPVILALYLALISAVASLIYTSRQHYYTSLAFCLLICFSAKSTLGVLYQLIGQISGLTLLTCALTLLLQNVMQQRNYSVVKRSLLSILALSALLIDYPEVLPFLALCYITFYSVNLYSGWRPDRKFFLTLSFTVLGIILLLNRYITTAFFFLLSQVTNGTKSAEVSVTLFPYYLIPNGLADFWGLQAVGVYPAEPFNSVTIFIGICLSIFAVFATIWTLRTNKKFAPAYMTSVMLFMFAYLFYKNSGFGLFKLAMYIQPFLLATLAVFIFKITNKTSYRAAYLLLFILFGFTGQQYYLKRSLAETSGGLSEIPHASTSKINKEFAEEIASIPPNSTILSTSFNIVIIKFQAFDAIGKKLGFCSSQTFKNIFYNINEYLAYASPALFKTQEYLRKQSEPLFKEQAFNLHDPLDSTLTNGFYENAICNDTGKNTFLVIETPLRTVINKGKFQQTNKNFIITPYSAAHDILIFTNSERGPIYYAYHSLKKILKSRTSFYNTEQDWYYPQDQIQAIGRNLLFRVINPSDKIRLKVNITSAYKADGKNLLVKAYVIGNNRVEIPLIGRGSGRVFSEIIAPQYIGGNAYLHLDMGVDGTTPVYPKRGLMKLYGNKISIDFRRIVSYARDITLVSDEEYRRLNPPTQVSKFPADLANPNLEYSGIYEDGWTSEHVFLTLKPSTLQAKFVLNGMLPVIDKDFQGSMLTILIDGKQIHEQKIYPGDFTINIPLSSDRISNKKIELVLDKLQHLPGDNPRPVAALIKSIGFQPLTATAYETLAFPSNIANFPQDLDNTNIKYSGWYKDGWLSGESYITLHQPKTQTSLVIKGMLPKYASNFNGTHVLICMDGRQIYNKIILPGDFTIKIPALSSKSAGWRKVDVSFNETQRFPANAGDNRIVAAHLSYIGFQSS